MDTRELLQWQWNGYFRNHLSRSNLLIHILAVPLFLSGNVGLIVAAITRSPLMAMACLSMMIVSVILQGIGHRHEDVAPEPFTSRFNAVSRIFLEQWITFPRFVFSGAWFRALRGTRN